MSRRTEIAEKYVEAQRRRNPASVDAFAAALTDDAVLVTRRGTVEGKQAIVERLRNPLQAAGGAGFSGGWRAFLLRRLARRRAARAGEAGASGEGGGILSQLQFGSPSEDGDAVIIKAKLPANPMFSGVTLTFTFDDQDRVKRIEQRLT